MMTLEPLQDFRTHFITSQLCTFTMAFNCNTIVFSSPIFLFHFRRPRWLNLGYDLDYCTHTQQSGVLNIVNILFIILINYFYSYLYRMARKWGTPLKCNNEKTMKDNEMGWVLNKMRDLVIFEVLYPYYRQSYIAFKTSKICITKMVCYEKEQRAKIVDLYF